MAVFLPTSDMALNAWSQNFSTKISATPTAFGLVAADATAFAALKTDFGTRLTTATNPDTRTKGTIAAKNTSRAALRAKARQLVKIIEAYPPLTAEQRADLGLRPRDTVPTAVPAPTTKPMCRLDPDGTLRITDETESERRARPAGTRGALIFTKVAPADAPAPQSVEETDFTMLATRFKTNIPLPPGSNNKTLYVFARWYNDRGEIGPVSPLAKTAIAA